MIKKEFDIVIVGAGLVGLSFANLLSSRLISSETIYGDKKIAILEKQPFKAPDLSNSFDSRVVALTQSSRIFLEDIGIWGKIVRERVCPFERMEIWESDGTGHIEFDCNDVRQDSLGYIVENSLVVRCLLNQVKKLKNVEFICPATVSDVQKNIYPGQSATSDITLNDGSVITTKLLVAADGGDSRIRDLCGFQMQEMNYGHQSIVARIATEKKT